MTSVVQNIKHGEILFQKMGNKWFVFTEIAGEILYSPLPLGVDPHTVKIKYLHVLEDHMKKVALAQKSENSLL